MLITNDFFILIFISYIVGLYKHLLYSYCKRKNWCVTPQNNAMMSMINLWAMHTIKHSHRIYNWVIGLTRQHRTFTRKQEKCEQESNCLRNTKTKLLKTLKTLLRLTQKNYCAREWTTPAPDSRSLATSTSRRSGSCSFTKNNTGMSWRKDG